MEADHLGGDVDMVAVVDALLEEQKRRQDAGRSPTGASRSGPITAMSCWTMWASRPIPGYPAIGRLRGLAEIRGVMTAVASLRQLPV